jgi:hypothetical protein
MTYICWTALYEGVTDKQYFDVLIPRFIEEILRRDGIRNSTIPLQPVFYLGDEGRDIETVSARACAHVDTFNLVFIHADTGGRNLEAQVERRGAAYCQRMNALCNLRVDRCIPVVPKHEMEAWAICDRQAVANALGYSGPLSALELPSTPAAAQRHADPKAALTQAITLFHRRRRNPDHSLLLTRIAQDQSFELLRRMTSFQEFEVCVRTALRSLGCIE